MKTTLLGATLAVLLAACAGNPFNERANVVRRAHPGMEFHNAPDRD